MIETFEISPLLFRSMGDTGRVVGGGTTFTNLVNGAGTTANTPVSTPPEFSTYSVAYQMTCDGAAAAWDTLYRGVLMFDTTSLQDNIRIGEATIRIYGYGKEDTGGDSPTVNIYGVDTNYTGDVVKEDFEEFGTTAFASDLSYADMSTIGGYNDIVLNDDGKKYIKKRAVTRFGIRESTYDAMDTDPGAVAGKTMYWGIYNAWEAKYNNNIKSPLLTIKYSRINTTFI